MESKCPLGEAQPEESRLLSDEETNKAFDNAFDKEVFFTHEPTVEEIITIRLKAVAQAQRVLDMEHEQKRVKEAIDALVTDIKKAQWKDDWGVKGVIYEDMLNKITKKHKGILRSKKG